MVNISKRFDATQALEDVSLTLYPGEVHAVIGENGAGKSTLIKIMTGVHRPDTGEILLDGKPVHVRNSQEAQTLGIAAIYQEPMVYPDLNVAENIFISHADRGPVVRWGKMYEDAEEILAKLGVKLDVRMPARGLTLAAQQAVEIAKAISLKVRVLIMDEPTASLSQHEVTQPVPAGPLAHCARRRGRSSSATAWKRSSTSPTASRSCATAKWISTRPRAEVNHDRVIRDMVGRDVKDFFAKGKTVRGELLASVRNLGKEGVFEGVSFDVYRGEVLGFAGLIGSHRTDVGLALFGVEPADSGEIIFEGQAHKITSRPPGACRSASPTPARTGGSSGLVVAMSVASNISLPMLDALPEPAGAAAPKARGLATAEQFRERLNIRTPSLLTEVARLSGGNQQKVMLSKWLNARSEAAHPGRAHPRHRRRRQGGGASHDLRPG